MQKVYLITDVYVITVDDLYKGTKFHVRATQTGAENLFKKIVKDYFDPEENTEEELEKALDLGFWKSKRGDVVIYTKRTAVAEEENLTVINIK